MKQKILSWLLVLIVLLTGCVSVSPPPVNPNPYDGLKFDSRVRNGLTNQERMAYYYQDEGIQYLPIDIMLSLNRSVGDGLGLYEERLFARPERFGLYPNPLGKNLLPVGLTSSQDTDYVKMGGINCATCHTQLISYQGKSFLVDGGSGLFAIDRFIKEMIFSTASTMLSPTEFGKFYDRYKARVNLEESEGDKQTLRLMLNSPSYSRFSTAVSTHLKKGTDPTEEVKRLVSELQAKLPAKAVKGKQTTLSGSYPTADELNSSLKMFAYLAKRLVFFYEQTKYATNPDGSTVGDSGLGRSNPWSVVKNMLASHLKGKSPADFPKITGGPINTPNIWGFDRSQWIFWSGVTNSMLERNMAQGVALVTDFNWNTYETTVSVKKLATVSEYAKKITPPEWPEAILGKIDQSKADKGRALYKTYCLGCHQESKSTGTASMSYWYMDVGTDPNYYLGQVETFYGSSLFKDALAPWLKSIKNNAYAREGITNPEQYEAGRLPVTWKAPAGNLLAARPLYGIWASAPYLHNGSVPSIRELLKKPTDRVMEFYVGSTEYDPVNLGFKSQPLYFAFNLQVSCDKCTGNSNLGHNYGTGLTDGEKDQLIEFLKSYTVDTEF